MITPDEQAAVLDAHNEWRARYQSPPLVWDAAVAAVAQDWADQIAASGQFEHRPDNRYGENIFGGTTGFLTPKSVVDDWGSEVADFDVPSVTCAPAKVCGHFTQLVWSTSARLGVGKSTGADGNDYWVANYDPPGNTTGESPFGGPVSTTDSGTPANSAAPLTDDQLAGLSQTDAEPEAQGEGQPQ